MILSFCSINGTVKTNSNNWVCYYKNINIWGSLNHIDFYGMNSSEAMQESYNKSFNQVFTT